MAMTCARRYALSLFLAACQFTVRAALAEELTDEEKVAIKEAASDFSRLHEGRPVGVPASYDWFSRPVMKQGNQPGDNKAMLGWGHAFWAESSKFPAPELQLRNLRVYLCSGSPGQWTLVQSGEIHGRQFDANFKQNTSQEVLIRQSATNELAVAFERGSAFHFWPKSDRHALPNKPICGIVVAVQAREAVVHDSERNATGHYVVGLGADYWRDRSSVWNGKDSNPGVALGRLRFTGSSWRWHILNTASESATMQLVTEGFIDIRSRK